MVKHVMRGLLLAGVAVLMWALPVVEAAENRARLVDADWLAANLGTPDVLVLDASMTPRHLAGHIPGAQGVDFLTYGFPERSLQETEQRYQTWGISPGKTLVLYDEGGGFMATRLFYALAHHGFPVESLFVLDGGLAKWQAKGQPVTKDATPAPPMGTFRITKTNDALRVRLPEFLAASGDTTNNVLLEALDPDWHFGESAFFGTPGHVPNAVMMPARDFFNEDKTFKSAEEIERMLKHLGIRRDQVIHTHCGGGVAASVPFFALKYLLGYEKVTLYQESQMGWLSDERSLPFWTYDAPHLMRASSWVNAWGGQRLRMFRGSDISIVDVRTPGAFDEGHVPYAVNVPGDAFTSHLANPAALAQVLGRAGVNPAHEAVIVSGTGLTREAALAFVLLEGLGQKKVSILMDSPDAWVRQGVPVTKSPTLVGPPASPTDLAVPSVGSSMASRRDVLIADPASPKGTFPRVFVASGGKIPAGVPDGNVVHVPYTSLLDAEGRPKPAKEIWKTLASAGISRYAEIVCISANPGEAAANYFLLRLMGFPDVKMLIR